jgi:hypothetical protein
MNTKKNPISKAANSDFYIKLYYGCVMFHFGLGRYSVIKVCVQRISAPPGAPYRNLESRTLATSNYHEGFHQ